MALNHAFGVVQWASSATVGTTYTVDLPAGFDLKAIRFYHSGYASSTDSVTQTVSAQGEGWGNAGMLHSSGRLILMGGGINGPQDVNKQVWVGTPN